MNELERLKEQLEMANRIILATKGMNVNKKHQELIKSAAIDYDIKYLKPKDPREEKFKSLLIRLGVGPVLPIPFDKSFAIFDELFKEERKGTKGLKELLKYSKDHYDIVPNFDMIRKAKEIIERLEGEEWTV